jgi:RING finger protein 113A
MEIEQVMPVFKKRNLKKSTIRKRPATPVASGSDSEYSSADEDGRRVKRRKKTGGVVVTSKQPPKPSIEGLSTSNFSADRSATIDSTSDATKQSNWYEEGKTSLDAKSLLGTTRARSQQDDTGASDGTYRGTTNYTSFIKKNPDAHSKQVGPVKAPTNIRTITVTDYSPDVCKDYKQTGFCGFGDGCKFLHAREDYKQGWQLDKEWETVTKGKNPGARTVSRRNKEADVEPDSEEEDAMLEGIPFACIICKEGYKYPIVTKCGHYFCEACAIQRFKKTPSCAACGAGTGGVFNGAKNLKKLLDKKRERAAKRRAEAKENGEEVSSSEEDGGGGEGEGD